MYILQLEKSNFFFQILLMKSSGETLTIRNVESIDIYEKKII